MSKVGLTLSEVDTLLNHRSGLCGIAGISDDIKQIIEAYEQGDKRARLAIEIFVYRIKKYIGSYISVLNGLDALVFTGNIKENIPLIREKIITNMDCFGIKLDTKRNILIGASQEAVISAASSQVKILTFHANEELVIAKETKDIINRSKSPTRSRELVYL